jgi:hypothetical protein
MGAARPSRTHEKRPRWAVLAAALRPRDLVIAVSLANLYFLSIWNEFQDRSVDYYRLVPYRTWSSFGTVLLDLAIVSLGFWLLIAAVERTRSALLRKAGCLFLLGLLLLGLDVLRTKVLHLYGTPVMRLIGRTSLLALCLAAGGGLLYAALWRERFALRAIRAALTALCFLAPVNILATATFVDGQSYRERFAPKPPLPLLPAAKAPRFVWVIFDEWDYYRSFPGRPQGLQLPEVDRFAAQALAAERAYPPAHWTLEALPSLTTGRIVRSSKPAPPDDLLLTYADAREPVRWSSQRTVFEEVRRLSVNSAVVGFWHPYQRILNASFAQGVSVKLDETEEYWSRLSGVEKIETGLENMRRRIPFMPAVPALDRFERLGRSIFDGVSEAAAKVLTRNEFGLLFLHYPIPHPPALYSNARGNIYHGHLAGYDDNLRLMDRTLGSLRSALEKSGEWDGAAVLLTSDHPLRMRGRARHPRIPFLLKRPGQREGMAYRSPFNTVMTGGLVLALLRGEIKDGRDAAAWLDRNRLNFPVEPPAPSRWF